MIKRGITMKDTSFARWIFWGLLPLEVVALIAFLAWGVTHPADFVARAGAITSWLVSLVGLALVVGAAWLVIRVFRSLLETILFGVNGVVDIKLKLAKGFPQESAVQVSEVAAPALSEWRVDADGFPVSVPYEAVRDRVPAGHILVGIGQQGIETKEEAVGACVWIVGLSGTGKTSTTVLRVEERATAGHQFIVCDPHWYKPDSLANATASYAHLFLRPVACQPGEIFAALQAFLKEFQGRKAGAIPQPWPAVTLIVDEVGSLMDATTREEKLIAELLPSVARVCGQEARNFNMGGIFISQQATGLAWLRKVALMVIVHQLLMESEKKLALNGDTAVMEQMRRWPVGRTYVYGVGFQDGPRIVQQPYIRVPHHQDEDVQVVDGEVECEGETEPLDGLTPEMQEAMRLVQEGAGPRQLQRDLKVSYHHARELYQLFKGDA